MAAPQEITPLDLLATWLTLPDNVKNDTQIASLVIKHFLGLPWVEKHLDPDATNIGPLTLKGTPIQIELAKIRIVDLAESLFNLHKISGIDQCIAHLSKAENPEPALAELHIGKMLYANDWEFSFVAPQGKRGSNYDFHIQYSGHSVCGDAKCKIESQLPDSKTITNTLKHSRTQLPADRPGVFFVKIPEFWMETPGWEQTTVQGALDFFAQGSGRIVSVAFYAEPIRLLGGSIPAKGTQYFAVQGHCFYEVANPRRRHGIHDDWKFFERWRPNNPGAWSAMPPKYVRLFEFPKGLKGLLQQPR